MPLPVATDTRERGAVAASRTLIKDQRSYEVYDCARLTFDTRTLTVLWIHVYIGPYSTVTHSTTVRLHPNTYEYEYSIGLKICFPFIL